MAIGVVCTKILKKSKSSTEGSQRGSKCGTRNPMGNSFCRNCGNNLKRGNLEYFIEYRDQGKRKYEYMGPSKQAAERRFSEIKKNQIEGKSLKKDPSASTSLGEMIQWYLNVDSVKSKRSYKRDVQLLAAVEKILGNEKKISEITPGLIDDYRHIRKKDPSPTKKGASIAPATINKETSQLITMLNKAVSHGKLNQNPLAGKIKKLVEDNVRKKVLNQEEFERLVSELKSPLREMFIVAFYLCMRQGEIIKLTWSSVDLEEGFIRLPAENTKNNLSRVVPIHPFVEECLKQVEKKDGEDRVFLSNGKPINQFSGNFQRQWKNATKKVGLEDFHFHDSRHCSINNLRLAQNDYFRIMAISGHKTMSVFKRYNYVTEDELKSVKWRQV